jgi:hypothetical protein
MGQPYVTYNAAGLPVPVRRKTTVKTVLLNLILEYLKIQFYNFLEKEPKECHEISLCKLTFKSMMKDL